MSANPSKPRLDGLNVINAWAGLWLARLKARSVLLKAWVSPAEPVLLFHPDGSQSLWRASSRVSEGKPGKEPKFIAIQVPDDLLLRRSLLLPRMSEAHTAEAILLEVHSNSPFPPEEIAWGSVARETAGRQSQIEIVIASRRHVSEFMQERWPELASRGRQPEVWALSGQNMPVVFHGYGESYRLHSAAIQRRWNWALLAMALVLTSLAAVTPTVQLRLRALEAADAFESVLRRVGPLVRKRDELSVLNDRLRSLDLAVAARVDPAGVMEYLTQILPDDTYLYSLDIQKAKITAAGHTVDASALLQKLSADPRLKDVRAPTAVTRLPGATKEAFIIEFTMEVKQASVSPASVSVAASAGLAAPTLAAAVAASSAGAPAAASKPTAPATPKPGSSPFVIGGSR